MSFESFGLHPALMRAIADLGFEHATPVQSQAIPAVLEGHDVVGKAQTGTGKTAAYGLPILHRLLQRTERRPRLLVIAPTRELAQQVHDHLRALAVHTPLRGFVVTGGEDRVAQENHFRLGTDWVTATPGRLLDHLAGNYVDFGALEHLVLDEADQLLELGFFEDIRTIISHLPERRNTLLFSATLPPQMQQLARAILVQPVRIDIGATTSADPIAEELWPVSQTQKLPLLRAMLKNLELRSALVFARTKNRVDYLAEALSRAGHATAVLHADKPMNERREALASFRRGDAGILVATDLAARGIDISGISHVINYDMPTAPEDYIHRVGRTGRAGRTGCAWTFMSRNEIVFAARIERLIGKRLPERRLEGFSYEEESEDPNAQIRERHHRMVHFNSRRGTTEKLESPFTKTGRARRQYEVPDPQKAMQKPARKRFRMKKRLPHEK